MIAKRFFFVAAFFVLVCSSAALAQNSMVSPNGPQAKSPRLKPKIVNPRKSSASPMTSSLNVSGGWSLSDCIPEGNCTLVLNQDQAGNITGTLNTSPFCPVPIWTISGAVTSNTTFTITATDPDGGDDLCDAWFTVDLTMTSSTSATGPWNSSPGFSGTTTMYEGGVVSLVDPVASGLLGGNGVTQNASTIVGASNPIYVVGAAADGVTQVIVEVTAFEAGDSVQLTLVNENGVQDPIKNGGLYPLGGVTPGTAAGTLTLTAQNTTPPMALAIWQAPLDYYRDTGDAATLQRSLTVQMQVTDVNGSQIMTSQNEYVMRPPVLLVHGMWSEPSAWSNFTPALLPNASLWGTMYKETANYNYGVSQVTATSPSYVWTPSSVNANALGFAFNAQGVLNAAQQVVTDYATMNSVAAVQADVVAHSMGGAISRLMPGVTTGPALFENQNNYGLGSVHKLITIGTPHQGTPLAVDLLPTNAGDPNRCVRNGFASGSLLSLQTVTILTYAGNVTVDGAVGDLAAAPTNLPGTESFPIAYLAGSTVQSINLATVGQTLKGYAIGTCADFLDPLALDLTPTGWNNVFGAANDALVPVSSQLNGNASNLAAGGNTYVGVIHTLALTSLGFIAPSELDSGSGIPDEVINLLNESVNGPDFY